VPDLEDLERVHVAEHVEEGHRERQPEVDHPSGALVLPAHQRDRAGQHPDAVEDVVEPGAEDRAGAGEPGQLAVHAVQHEAQVVEHRAHDQPAPVGALEAGGGAEAQHQRGPGDLVGRQPGVPGGPPHQRGGERIDQQHRPPRVALLLRDAADLGERRYPALGGLLVAGAGWGVGGHAQSAALPGVFRNVG
jgi:hypothetical protein